MNIFPISCVTLFYMVGLFMSPSIICELCRINPYKSDKQMSDRIGLSKQNCHMTLTALKAASGAQGLRAHFPNLFNILIVTLISLFQGTLKSKGTIISFNSQEVRV